MHMDPLIPYLAGTAVVILFLGIVLKRLRQPHVVGYIVAGVLIGPSGFGFLSNPDALSTASAIGVLFLLFFVGMELPIASFIKSWKVPVIGTFLQILASVGFVWVIGSILGWTVSRIVFLGFVISLSSTAVVLKLLQDSGDIHKSIGRDVIGILLAQDLAIVPMIIILALLGGEAPSATEIGMQVVGGLGLVSLVVWAATRKNPKLPGARFLSTDHELQVFAALAICFGLGFLSGCMGLSAALGAFVAGILVAEFEQTHWVHRSLDPFRIVFVGSFFLSVGMLIDLSFLMNHWKVLGVLVAAALATNTLLNAAALRFLERSWPTSLYGGALLAQIGEFSFVLAAIGHQTNIITDFAYQTTIAVIALTLLVSPSWILLFKKLTRQEHHSPASP